MSDKSIAEAFESLFKGSAKAYGVHSGKSNTTVKKAYTLQDIKDHLNGKKSIGLIPINQDSKCYFGAIDIDDHTEDASEAIHVLDEKLQKLNLPLILCKSKSKGFHAYIFFKEPTSAKQVRLILTRYAQLLGYPKSEIFPKQETITKDKDDVGNWLNLPYFQATQTTRYAVCFGEICDLTTFVMEAKHKQLTHTDVSSLVNIKTELTLNKHIVNTPAVPLKAMNPDITDDMPPCIVSMIYEGVPEGSRNDVMYHITVYAKKAYPNDYRDWCFNFNTKYIKPPLTYEEAKRTITSAARRDYKYKCSVEPMKGYCNAGVCEQKKYGIEFEDKKVIDVSEQFSLTGMTKINTEPPKYEMYINGKFFACHGDVFFNYKRFHFQVLDYLMESVPSGLQKNWSLKMLDLVKAGKFIDAPEDSSQDGMIRDRFRQYVQNAWIQYEQNKEQNREDLLHGTPIIGFKNEILYVFFIGNKFVNQIRNDHITNKAQDVFSALRRMNCVPMKLSVKSGSLSVWAIAIKQNNLDNAPEYAPLEIPEEL